MELASLFFGLFIGVFVFTFAKVLDQTRTIWGRTHSLVNAYVFMIWMEMSVNLVFAIITVLFMHSVIPGSVAFYVATVLLWAIQTQLLPQIIANRVSLIMTNRRRARIMKWVLFIVILSVNIAVALIWIPAQLPSASPQQIKLNHIFEKTEKAFFLIIDLALNIYFLYLVRYRLIADGLSKYWRLFNFNVGAVFVSTSMDILLLGFLSLPDEYVYVQFAPSAYIVKLYIELVMAVLIGKVVRSGSDRQGGYDWQAKSSSIPNPTATNNTRVTIASGPSHPGQRKTFMSNSGMEDVLERGNSSGSDMPLATYPDKQGITKTIETSVVVGEREDAPSDSSR